MDNDDEYRRQAAEAQVWADRSTTSEMDKAAWLRVAQGWLSLIRGPKRTEQDKFDDVAKAQGTGQDDSKSSH
jgi:hypothetical protein